MARLNEPPVAPAPIINGPSSTGAESVEALKRRFIRQNRELAKNNSSQSLRIRSLELEVSRLLSDNLDLRGQVLNLQNEVHNARKETNSHAVRKMKCDLREKIAELSGMVDGLDEDVEEERTPVERERILSPSQRQYRERQPLGDLMQDALMPTISEDKYYPRRTLDQEDICAIRLSDQSGASGSPDLGPPPVAHFDYEDPIKFNAGQEEEKQESPKEPEEELLPSINLETRRRRRESQSKSDIRRHSLLSQSESKSDSDSSSTMLRTGAKRKLADRETEKPIKPPSKGDFTFSRRASAAQSNSDEEKAPPKNEKPAKEAPAEEPPVSPVRPARKVLGEKSVNMSPKKVVVRGERPLKGDLEKPAPELAKPTTKSTASKERPPSRGRRVSSIPLPSPSDEVAPTIELPPPEPSTAEQLHSNTPALQDDIFSPQSQPTATGACDTPPPADLSSISNTTEGGQRPSRRVRSAVNYAEPSLVAKMRRPGKQMVDAITGLQDPRQVMNPKDRERKSTSRGSVSVKREPMDEEDESWKSVPNGNEQPGEGSPLREKSTDEHPRPSTGAAEEPLKRPSSSGSQLSSAVANSRKRREAMERRSSPPLSTTTDVETQTQAAAKKMEELDLYDFKASSSPATDTSSRPASPERERRTAAGGTKRRHSTLPKEAPTTTTTTSTGAASTSTLGTRVASRRRSMML